MRPLVSNFELLKQTVDNFNSSEPYFSAPVDFPYPFPVIYTPNSLEDAAYDTLLANGYNPIEVGTKMLPLKNTLAEHAQRYIPGYPEVFKQRAIGALILNNYSEAGPFNPN